MCLLCPSHTLTFAGSLVTAAQPLPRAAGQRPPRTRPGFSLNPTETQREPGTSPGWRGGLRDTPTPPLVPPPQTRLLHQEHLLPRPLLDDLTPVANEERDGEVAPCRSPPDPEGAPGSPVKLPPQWEARPAGGGEVGSPRLHPLRLGGRQGHRPPRSPHRAGSGNLQRQLSEDRCRGARSLEETQGQGTRFPLKRETTPKQGQGNPQVETPDEKPSMAPQPLPHVLRPPGRDHRTGAFRPLRTRRWPACPAPRRPGVSRGPGARLREPAENTEGEKPRPPSRFHLPQ